MKVFVTGATGFLGSHVAEKLEADGHQVRALVRRTSKTEHLRELGVELVEGSMSDERALRRAVEGVDAVVHAAGVVKVVRTEEFHEVNAGGTRRLVEAVLDAAPGISRFVLVSSMAAMGGNDGERPLRADDPPRPPTHYGRSKLAAEKHVLAAADRFPVTILRPTAIYGPRDTEYFKFFQSISVRFMAVPGDGRVTYSYVWGPDCADAACRALTVDHPSGRVYLVSDGEAYPFDEIIRHTERAVGKRALRVPMPIPLVRTVFKANELLSAITKRPAILRADKIHEIRTRSWHMDTSPLRDELGWEPRVRYPEGSRLAVEWYRANGWL